MLERLCVSHDEFVEMVDYTYAKRVEKFVRAFEREPNTTEQQAMLKLSYARVDKDWQVA